MDSRWYVDTHLHVHLATQFYLESLPFVERCCGVRTDMYLHGCNCNKIFLDKTLFNLERLRFVSIEAGMHPFHIVLALEESEKVNFKILSFPAYKKRSIVCVFEQHREADR